LREFLVAEDSPYNGNELANTPVFLQDPDNPFVGEPILVPNNNVVEIPLGDSTKFSFNCTDEITNGSPNCCIPEHIQVSSQQAVKNRKGFKAGWAKREFIEKKLRKPKFDGRYFLLHHWQNENLQLSLLHMFLFYNF
jgi:hypothetical protein